MVTKLFSYTLEALLWLVSFLPFRVLYLISDINFLLLYYVVRYRRRVVRTNLINAFPEKEISEIRVIERKFYRHLSDIFFELYKMWHISEKNMQRRCVFKNVELIDRNLTEGRSMIGVIGHYANWEWLSSFALWCDKGDFLVLYKPLHNKVLDSLMLKIRSRFGLKLIPKNDVLREIKNYRDAGRSFIVGFIGDQTPSVHNLNFWTIFLNQETPVLLGTEKIARKYDMSVVFIDIRKIKRGYYEVEFTDLCSRPTELQPGELTIMHTRKLETIIKERPEYWLWSHRRWKHKRNGDSLR